jgi:hypothetical protein
MKQLMIGVVVVAALATGACLQKDTSSTIYLDPSGSLEWMVLERDVQSDSDEPATRQAEEDEYLDALRRDEHPVATAFRALGGMHVTAGTLRASRPYAAVVQAEFSSLTALVAPLLDACQVPHGTDVRSDGAETTWTLWMDVGPDGDLDTPEGCDTPFEGLLEAMDVTIALTSGHFTHAQGFTLGGNTRAKLDEDATKPDALARNGGRLVFSLRWTDK